MSNDTSLANRRSLLLITRPSLQATALLYQIKTMLSLDVRLQNISRYLDTPPEKNALILFDLLATDKKTSLNWQNTLGRNHETIRTLLLNTPEEYHFKEIECWPQISAVFYSSAGHRHLMDGISSVIRGEYYFSQQLASYLLSRSGGYRFNYGDSSSELTQREKEILNKLRLGASNIEIANLLFISENTVKTHLYNLFRKISVKNRTQAVSWANEHLQR